MSLYQNPLIIDQPLSNNAFSYEKRENKKITVPSLTNGLLEDLKIGSDTVFEDFDENGNLKSCFGLQNFIRAELNGVPAIIFDNHNHAFYFWHESRGKGIIQDGTTLVHIDQHTDMRQPDSFLSPKDSQDLEKVFKYTNSVLNVGNFIIPAQKTGLINQVIQIRSETSLQDFNPKRLTDPNNIILDLDLDLFAPELNYIDFNLAKKKILEITKQASLITIATSPFFIDQELAIKKLQALFT